MVFGAISGGSVNPARTLGPYGATVVFSGAVPWGQLWIYWVGPLVGGAIGAIVYDLIARPEREPAVAADEQGTQGEIEGRRVVPESERGARRHVDEEGEA
jgi:glycerol uptake facilitator protein